MALAVGTSTIDAFASQIEATAFLVRLLSDWSVYALPVVFGPIEVRMVIVEAVGAAPMAVGASPRGRGRVRARGAPGAFPGIAGALHLAAPILALTGATASSGAGFALAFEISFKNVGPSIALSRAAEALKTPTVGAIEPLDLADLWMSSSCRSLRRGFLQGATAFLMQSPLRFSSACRLTRLWLSRAYARKESRLSNEQPAQSDTQPPGLTVTQGRGCSGPSGSPIPP